MSNQLLQAHPSPAQADWSAYLLALLCLALSAGSLVLVVHQPWPAPEVNEADPIFAAAVAPVCLVG